MKLVHLLSLAFLMISGLNQASACSVPHPYAWMDLIVPEIEFKGANLTDVVGFFNAFIAESVTNKPSPRISVAPSTFEPEIGDKSQEIPLITFSARYVQIGCSLKIISAVAGMTYRASETGAVIMAIQNEPGGQPGKDVFQSGMSDPFAPPLGAERQASEIVATISSHPVSLAKVNPMKDVWDQKKGELTPGAFAQWLLAFRAGRLVGLVKSSLFQQYAIEKRLTPSDQAMERFSAMSREIRRESNDLIIQKAKASAILSEKQKQDMLIGIGTDSSSQKASANEFARNMIQNWNVQRSLHAAYGGRLLLSSLGYHTAIDAVRKFLMEKEASGVFKLHDATLATAFWDAVVSEKGDGIVEEAKASEILANPPWAG